ncbi:response regulator [Verrucomicrobiaceae bacterium 5K15]|uniref:Response regulator n=1 Tax=Oceaniferula flava TaxID=2800421 RepID=A0AAE2SBX1_9BACT|nr:response regulator [Oceaniferula flavus]MBK1853446.1 response regulator [Oceaniferula flavus]MBM1134751.1 response regulator [Oceaniferula flavus]
MTESPNKEHLILFVDDEEKTRKYFARLFGQNFEVLVAEDGVQALEIFRENMDRIGVVVTDQRMPNMTGSQLLEKVAEMKPTCIRILSTAYADVDAAVDSVNKGGIYRYVTKPWEVNDLEMTLNRAMERYVLEKERGTLLKQKLSSVEMLASSDRVLSIATIAVIGHPGLRHVGQALTALVQLAEVGGSEDSDEAPLDQALNWRELYGRHLSYLRSIHQGLTRDKLKGFELDYSRTVAVGDVMGPLVGGNGYFEWLRGEPSTTGWPGPAETMAAEISTLLMALEAVMRDAGILLVSEIQGGIEFRLSSRLLARNLEPLRTATKDAPSTECLALASSLFRLADAGAFFEVVPEEGRDMIRFKVTFDPTRNPDTGVAGWDSLMAALTGNDVFWARYGG